MGDTKRNNFDNGLLYGLAITALIDKLKHQDIHPVQFDQMHNGPKHVAS